MVKKLNPNSNLQRWLELRKVAGHPFRPSLSSAIFTWGQFVRPNFN